MEIIKKKPKTREHAYIPELKDLFQQGRITRREFLRNATLLGMSVAGASTFLTACGSEPVAGPTVRPAEGLKRGGTMNIATRVPAMDHPARLSWIEPANQFRQVCEYLTYTDYDNITHPWLLEKWEANEALDEWTLTLQKGIKFNDGQELTADDVIFNFGEWLDPAVGSSMPTFLTGLSAGNVEKVDEYTVKLYFDSPLLSVPESLFHYPAMIVPKTFEGDIIRQPIGTGPFLLEEFVVDERAVFTRREDYWRNGEDGKPLPYIDKLVYLDLGEEEAAQIAALQSGQVDNIFNPSAEIWQAVKDLPGIEVYSAPTAQTFIIRMKVTEEPWTDNRVRQALKKCIERQKMLDLAWFGNGVLAHDAHIAPVHPAYCEKEIPEYDPEGAKALLQEAGLTLPVVVELTTQEARAEPAMAQVLKESAAAGGFDIQLNIVPSTVYWEVWTQVPLGITIWAHRPLGTMALSAAYTTGADGSPGEWNETSWVDQEFIDLLTEAGGTLDVEKRREIMCKVEDIQMERGSVGVGFWTSVLYIAHEKIKNVDAHPTNYDILYEAWIDEA